MFKNDVSRLRIVGISIVSAVFAASSFADAITWEGTTNLTMTANTTVDVPAGTTNVIDTLGGAYTLTKTGGGVLQIRYVKSAAATVIVSQGMLRFANPRPDDIFEKAVFHVDASDSSSMTIETMNGTNFVKRWNDTDGRTGVYATPSTATTYGRVADRYPYIGSEKLNGLSYVDFGSLHTRYYTNELGKARGWGGAMNWNKSVTFKEGFTVVSDTPDIMELGSLWAKIGGYGMSFFSRKGSTPGFRGPLRQYYPPRLYHDNSQNNPYTANGSSNIVDGVYMSSPRNDSIDGALVGGFHVMNLVMPSSSAAADAFGAQDCGSTYTSFGGTRIAEYALFTNILTAAERDTMTGYLRIKWLGPTSCSVKVAPGASLVVDESANLRLPVAADGADVTVSTCTRVGGELDSAVYAAGPTMRLDASVTNTMAIVPMNGTNFVESWKDVDGRKWYAVEEHTTGKNGQRTDPEKRMPYLNPVLSQNGLPVVDLGSFIYTTNTNGHGGAFNYFGFKSLSVAEYMSVISDTEDLKTTTAGQYGPSYMSQRDAGKFDGTNDGRRGKTVKNAYPAIFFNPGASYNNPCKNGTNYVNGVQLAYTASPPEGFNVVNIRPRSAISCNLIGRHMRGAGSNNIDCYGGQRIAEYMIFSKLVPEETRDRIYKALRAKWFGETPVATNYYNNLTLGANASMTHKGEMEFVTNKLAIAGSIVASSVFAANIDVAGAHASVAAPLTIPDGAELSFARGADGAWTSLSVSSLEAEGAVTVALSAESWRRVGGTSALLVASETPIASIENWSLAGVPESAGASLVLRDGCVWVDFADQGLFIIVK